MQTEVADLRGGCACRALRYRLVTPPLVVHACHCRDCQRLTGSAFVINIWIERRYVEPSGALPQSFVLRAGSRKPHEVFFCGRCGTTLWSRYHNVPADTLFVRAGTLDTPDAVAPDVHIFTRSKLPWLALPANARAFEAGYAPKDVWPAGRYARLRQAIEEQARSAG